MNSNKFANRNHEDDGRRSSRDWYGRISKRAQALAYIVNRIAKHNADRFALEDQDDSDVESV